MYTDVPKEWKKGGIVAEVWSVEVKGVKEGMEAMSYQICRQEEG